MHNVLANLCYPLLLEQKILVKMKKIYCYCKEGIKFMKCIERKQGSMSLKHKAKVEQNLKVKHFWLKHYGRLNMTRLIYLN